MAWRRGTRALSCLVAMGTVAPATAATTTARENSRTVPTGHGSRVVAASPSAVPEAPAAESWAATAKLNPFGDLDVSFTERGRAMAEASPAQTRDAVMQVINDAAQKTARGCTLTLRGPHECAVAVPLALACGYRFHRATGDDCIMRFFAKHGAAAEATGEDPLPMAAHTMMATGGVVFNSRGEVLLIRQTYDRHAEWRLPGGALDPHETLVQGAAREVGEETGVKVQPLGVLSLRQAPVYESLFGKGFLGASVLFAVDDSAETGADDGRPVLAWPKDEILEARWVPLAHALRPFPALRASRQRGTETAAQRLARARQVSDTVSHGMTRSAYQRVSVVRGAMAAGLVALVPEEAIAEAVSGGCITEGEVEAARAGIPGAVPLLREVFHADGFPHGRQGLPWYALMPGPAPSTGCPAE